MIDKNRVNTEDLDGKILITGATGWLGKRMIHALKGVNDLSRIRCLVSPQDDTRFLRDLNIQVVSGDIRDPDATTAFLNAADGSTIFHLAGVIHPQQFTRDFYSINLNGTMNLYSAACKVRAKKLIIMSSNSPLGCNPNPDHRFTEESPYNPYMGYGKSKHQMELAIRSKMVSANLPAITLVRAPWFYGPGQPARQTTFFSMIKNGKFPIIGSGENKRSMTYVDSLVSGLLLAATHHAAANDIFWFADRRPYTMNEIIETIRAVLRDDFGFKVKDTSIKLPSLVSDVARVVDATLQATGLYHQKIHVLSEMNQTIACDISKAERLLGFNPVVELREGMRRSVEFCISQGIVI